MKNNNEIIKVDIFDVLLDENNTAPIYMYNENGEQIEFEQIAVIPYGENDLYCILKPLTCVKGIAPDEAVVFQALEDENGDGYLRVVDDENLACTIFEKYYELIEEEMK